MPELAQAVTSTCSRPDAVLVFASEGGELESLDLESLMGSLAAELGTSALVGASAQGVVGAGREVQGGPGVAVLAFEGLDAWPFLVPDLAGADVAADLLARTVNELLALATSGKLATTPEHVITLDEAGPAIDAFFERSALGCTVVAISQG